MSSGIAAKQGPVFRNALILVGAQLLGTPLTIAINAVMGRYLGPSNLGDLYLSSTFVAFAFLFVEWGHSGVLQAEVAQNRARAGLLMGSSIGWRIGMAIIASVVLGIGCWAFGYSASFRWVLAIVCVHWLIITVTNACQDTVVGFERTDVSALGKLGSQILTALLVIPTVIFTRELVSGLLSQMLVLVLVLVLVWRATRRAFAGPIVFDWKESKGLMRRGSPFLVFSFSLALQGNVDAVFLSRLTSPEVVGWHAAAQRLSGALNIPAAALVAALYPTLARLRLEDMDAFRQTARQALRGTTILAVPLAMCCAIYRDVGISLYGKGDYGPAGQNLLIMSGLLFLVYFSMPLGTTLVAGGKQRAWAIAQASCVLVSFALNPILIPYFQTRYGNGGLGVCIGAVTSEVFMVTVALFLAPKGTFDWSVATAIGKAFLAGAAMAAVAYLLSGVSPFISAPLAVVSYGLTLWLIGGIDPSQIEAVKHQLRRRFSRNKG